MTQFDWKSKTAVVTGGGQGIGWEAAKIMVRKGAAVYIIDADEEKVLRINKPGITAFCGDISNEGRMAEIFREIGPVHVLINNAGIQKEAAFEDIDVADFCRTLEVNLIGTFICTREALRQMPEGGTILNALTHEGRRTNLYPYAASKAAIKNMMLNLAEPLGKRGISINGIAFGAVYSERNAHWLSDERQVQKARERTPLGFILQPEEVAWQMVSFIESASAYATGTVLDVSGGRSLK